MKRLLLATGVIAVAAMATVVMNHETQAADHTDSPSVTANPKADIDDFFSWIDGTDLVLVMTVERNAAATAKFSDAVLYSFHVNRTSTGAGKDTEVICKFDSADNKAARCWVGDATTNIFLSGDPTNAATPLTKDGVKVFAGLRDDPFFFNITGFGKTAAAVNTTFLNTPGALNLNADGCPNLSGGLGADLLACLTTKCDQALGGAHTAGENDFAGENVLALIVTVPLATLGAGDNIKTHASTHMLSN